MEAEQEKEVDEVEIKAAEAEEVGLSPSWRRCPKCLSRRRPIRPCSHHISAYFAEPETPRTPEKMPSRPCVSVLRW